MTSVSYASSPWMMIITIINPNCIYKEHWLLEIVTGVQNTVACAVSTVLYGDWFLMEGVINSIYTYYKNLDYTTAVYVDK